jgi:hypothetical protein
MVDGRSWDDRSIAVDRHGDSVYKEMLEKSPFFNGLLSIIMIPKANVCIATVRPQFDSERRQCVHKSFTTESIRALGVFVMGFCYRRSRTDFNSRRRFAVILG